MTKITAMDKMNSGDVKFLFVMGENTIVSDPNANHAIHALNNLDFFVVQDIFMTQTAKMADLVLPASSFAEANGTFVNTERRVQRVRPAVETPGNAKLTSILFWDSMRLWVKNTKLLNLMRYGRKWLVLLPYLKELIIRELKKKVEYSGLAPDENHPGTPYLHKDQMESGETGIFSPVDHIEPAEPTDKRVPICFINW